MDQAWIPLSNLFIEDITLNKGNLKSSTTLRPKPFRAVQA